jgi:thioredoxin-related protein
MQYLDYGVVWKSLFYDKHLRKCLKEHIQIVYEYIHKLLSSNFLKLDRIANRISYAELIHIQNLRIN